MSTHPDPQTADADQLREAADDAWERGDWRTAAKLMRKVELALKAERQAMLRPPVDYVRIRARLEAGEFNADLAREHGVSRAAITRGAQRAGWAGPQRGQRKKGAGERYNGSKLKVADRLVIAERARDGVARSALAAEYGVCYQRIAQVVREYAQ